MITPNEKGVQFTSAAEPMYSSSAVLQGSNAKVIVGRFASTKKSSGSPVPQWLQDIESVSEAQLKRMYRPEWNTWRSRRDHARKNNYAWDARFVAFSGFLRVMGPKPFPNYTLDKVVASRGYIAENCRWASPQQQAVNRDTTHFLTAFGQTHPIAEWARINGIPEATIHARIRRGWKPEDALDPTIGKRLPQRSERQSKHTPLPWPERYSKGLEAFYQRSTGGREDRLIFLARTAIRTLLDYPDPPCMEDEWRALSPTETEALREWERRHQMWQDFFALAKRGLASRRLSIFLTEESLRDLSRVTNSRR